MISNKKNPQFVQNGIDRTKPRKQSRKAIQALGYFEPHLVSQITVAAASTIEKAESTPKVRRVTLSMIAQRFGALIRSQAVG